MPRYDYRCTSCGAVYERREGFDAPFEHACQECGAIARRVFVAPPILFKGSGFYVTDSKRGSSAVSGSASRNGHGGDRDAEGGDGAGPAKAEPQSEPAKTAGGEAAATT